MEWAAEALHTQDPNWHIVMPPQQGVINFRYAPPGLDEAAQDRLNDEISTAMLEEGYAAVLTTKLSGRTVLRICALSPATTQHDIDSTIAHLTHFAQTLHSPHA